MPDRETPPSPIRFALDSVGLCRSCRHARSIASARGSTFWMCGRHEAEPAYPKYPRLPVLQCRGYEEQPPA